MYKVHRRQVLNECWPTPAMVVEGIHVEDIFELNLIVSLVLSLIISRLFRILTHEEDHIYTDFLSITLNRTKTRPRVGLLLFQFILSFRLNG